MNNEQFLAKVTEALATIPKGETHTIKVEVTFTFEEMDGTPEETAELALSLLDKWSQDHIFTIESEVTDF